MSAIREMYLGASQRKKRRITNPNGRHRFSFDWDEDDDTSQGYDPFHQAQLLFGRGFRAGTDRIQQKKEQYSKRKFSSDALEPRKQSSRNEIASSFQENRDRNQRESSHLSEKGLHQVKHDSHRWGRSEKGLHQVSHDCDLQESYHWSKKGLHEMSARDWRIFQEDFDIAFKGSHAPRPIRNWKESGLSRPLLKAIHDAGYEKPSPIQMAAIPIGLRQRDLIGIAETGSGKTASFVLPMLAYVSKLPPIIEDNRAAAGPYAVVLAPTRELAQQIEQETMKLSCYLGARTISIVGGHPIEEQGMKLSQGYEIVIATPGRLLDCLQRRYVVLNQCNYVVLDEGDRLIDMGFELQVIEVLKAVPTSTIGEKASSSCTISMFSATMSPPIEKLSHRYLKNPIIINVGTNGKVADLVKQEVVVLKDSEKFEKLKELLNTLGESRSMVFVNSRETGETLVRKLEIAGYKAMTLHGGRSQEQREVSLEGFKRKRFTCLVATDVAGRGIHVPDVSHVINYDMTKTIDQYVHRIGRTGRAGKVGTAITFLTFSDTLVFYDLKRLLIQSNSVVPPQLARHEASKSKPGTFAPCI